MKGSGARKQENQGDNNQAQSLHAHAVLRRGLFK